MADGKSSKQAKGTASKGVSAASKKDTRQPSKNEGKEMGTRFGTILNIRSADKKSGGGGSCNRLRDGS